MRFLSTIWLLCGLATVLLVGGMASAAPASGKDAAGCKDHPALTRYPGMVLEWCRVENYLPYKFPMGPVTGYRTIGEIEEIGGRVTRNFYSYKGEDRTHAEVWKNYSDALKAAGFEILGQGMVANSNNKPVIGGGGWQGVALTNNAWSNGGPANKMLAGTSTSGGNGAVLARKVRAEDTIWIAVFIEQHSRSEIAMFVDIIETKNAETGLVTANAEAMSKDLTERGRTVIEGLMFDHDKATLTAASRPALDEAAKLIRSMPGKSFYVVGHTDSDGDYAYNTKLSLERAQTVRARLVKDYGIAPGRLQAVGVGPVSPVLANTTAGGKTRNRRVELVER